MKISNNILPASSRAPSSLVVGFKDGKTLRFVEGGEGAEGAGKEGEVVWDLKRVGVRDVVEEVDRHSRALRRREELAG